MKAKFLLLSLGFMAAASMSAQNFTFMCPQGMIERGEDGVDGVKISGDQGDIGRMEVWFDTDFAYAKVNADNSITSSVSTGKTIIIKDKETCEANKNLIHGAHVIPTWEDGMWTAVVPSEITYPSTATYNGKGTLMFHIIFEKPYRINDENNPWNAYLNKDGKMINGVYAGVKAPAGCTVQAIISSPGEKLSPDDGTGNVLHAAHYDATTQLTSNDFTEIYCNRFSNHDAIINYTKSGTWPYGYCGKFVAIAISGVKAGDKVQLSGIQTSYNGFTFTPGTLAPQNAAVNEIFNDNANAEVEVYNLQGVKVNAETVTPGIYVRRQGTKTEKVIIK